MLPILLFIVFDRLVRHSKRLRAEGDSYWARTESLACIVGLCAIILIIKALTNG